MHFGPSFEGLVPLDNIKIMNDDLQTQDVFGNVAGKSGRQASYMGRCRIADLQENSTIVLIAKDSTGTRLMHVAGSLSLSWQQMLRPLRCDNDIPHA